MGFKDVFPDKASVAVCLAYMGTFILQGILTRASQSDGKYIYNPTTAVLVAEAMKLMVAVSIYLKEHGLDNFLDEFATHRRLLWLYMAPAFLYCVYNNLTFVNLANYDPASYYLLLQFRVVVTGVLFQCLFDKRLSRKQWFSLGLLTLGCVVKEYGTHYSDGMSLEQGGVWWANIHTALILVQVFCSCLAGVYNERLLKKEGQHVPLMMQNTYMYLDSVLANVFVLAMQGELGEVLSAENISHVLTGPVVAVCVNNAAIGIVTSLFLKKLNSLVKVYASAVELILTAYLSWFIFGIPVDGYVLVALVLIVTASYLYAMYPVQRPEGLPK